jgi:hypothetical protein
MLNRSLHTDCRISKDSLRRSIAVLLLGVQLVGGLGVLGHTHAFALRLVADPALAAHECGEQEHHIPLDSIHPCVICWQLYQRVSVPIESIDFIAVHSLTAGLCSIAIPPVIAGDHFFPDKRGPPAIV